MISGRYFLVKRSVCASTDSRRVADVSCGHIADDSGLIRCLCHGETLTNILVKSENGQQVLVAR